MIAFIEAYTGVLLAGGELLVMEWSKPVSHLCVDVVVKFKGYGWREYKPGLIKRLIYKVKGILLDVDNESLTCVLKKPSPNRTKRWRER